MAAQAPTAVQEQEEVHGSLKEALGEIFGCSREGFGPL